MGEWECSICGFIDDVDTPLSECPDCGAPKERFTFYPYFDDSEWEDEFLFDGIEIEEEYTSSDSVADTTEHA